LILMLAQGLRTDFCVTHCNRLCSRNVIEQPFQTYRVKVPPHLNLGLWLGLVVVVGAVLRFFRLGTKSFWLDEATSTVLAQASRHVFVTAIFQRQANMVLYYILLRGWLRLGGGEFVVRSLSVVAGVAAIPAIYLLGTRLFGPRAGRIAALLLCVHAFHIRYSQEARAYSLFMLLAILSSLFFVRALEQPSRKIWAAYILLSALMVYAQVFGGWILLAQWMSILFLRREVCWKEFLFSVAVICLLIAPLAYCLLFVSDRSQLSWATKPTLQDLYKFSFDLSGDGGPMLLLAYMALLLGGVTAGLSRASASATQDTRKYSFLLCWLVLPVACVLAVSLRWPAFEPRFLICCVPPVVLLVADAVARIRSQILFSATLVILLLLSLSATYSYYGGRADAEHSDDWRDATRSIVSQAEAGDAVLFSYSEERLAFDEYQRQLRITGSPFHEFPEQTDLELLTLRPSRPSPELLDKIVTGYKRVWVVSAFQPNRASRPVEATLTGHFRGHEDQSFGFVHADLFVDQIVRPGGSTER